MALPNHSFQSRINFHLPFPPQHRQGFVSLAYHARLRCAIANDALDTPKARV